MNEIVQDKMAREIMVVANDKLFAHYERSTKFYSNDEHNFEWDILENYEYMVRWEAEENTLYKQPITYGVIINKENEIFVYKRGWKNSNVWDMRFQSFLSFWIGWHIEREDEDSENLLIDALVREVEEELNIPEKNLISVDAIWFINDDSAILHEVHIWIAYVVRVDNADYALLDGELENGEFISLEELEKMIESPEYELENWSKILFQPLKNILEN